MASASERQHARSAGMWTALGVLLVLYFLNSLDRGLLTLLVKPIRTDLGIDDFQMSLLLGLAFALFYAVCGVPIGWIVDRFSRRITLFVGVSFWSAATIASGLAQNYPQLLFARMALGVGEATLGPAAHSIIADKFPRERLATALSIYTAGAVLGTGGSIALGGLAVAALSKHATIDLPLLGPVAPWQAAFIFVGLPGLLLAYSVFLFREPARQHDHTAPRVSVIPFLRERRAVLLSFVGTFALFSMAVYGSLSWLPTYMDRAFGWDAGRAGPILGVLNIVTVGVGTIGGGMIADRLFRQGKTDAHLRVAFGGILIGTPPGIIGFLSHDPVIFLVCLAVLKTCCFSFVGYAAGAVQAISPAGLRGRMAALYLLALALIGNGGGPSLVAFLSERFFGGPAGLGAALALSLAILAPIALVAAWLGMGPMREAVAALQRAEAPMLAQTAPEHVSAA